MAIQHIGSNDSFNLLNLRSNDGIPFLSFTIKGKLADSKLLKCQDDADSATSVLVKSNRTFDCYVKGNSYDGSDLSPLFFEWVDYELILEVSDDAEYELEINGAGSYITPLNENHSKGGNIYSGIVNFKDSIGYSDLILKRNKAEICIVTIEVFPKKISYRKDYKELKDDVSSILYGLLFSALEKTYSRMVLEKRGYVSDTESLSILNAIYNRFKTSVDLVVSKPHHQLVAINELMPPEKAARFDSRARHWIDKHPERVKVKDGKIVDAGKILSTRKTVVFDTKENRYAKHLIRETVSLIGRIAAKWERYSEKTQKDPTGNIVANINRMKHELNARLEESFFQDVREEYQFDSMSLVFSMAPGYRDLYKYYLMLKMGLSEGFAVDELLLSLKGLSTLYEYWCFIKLNSIMKERYSVSKGDEIKIDTTGLFATLVKGERAGASRVEYLTEKGDVIYLEYNQKNKQDTINQKPDNVFRLVKKDFSSDTYWEFIFDAKYRLKVNTSGPFRYEAEDDDINTMHRYRDSILVQDGKSLRKPYQRKTIGAFVLYPYPDSEDEYRKHKNYMTVHEQNIGAFPFLPGHTELLEKFLDQLVFESPFETLRRSPLPAGYEFMMHQGLYTAQDTLAIVVDSIDTCHNTASLVYSSYYHHFALREDSELFRYNPNTRFRSFAVIGRLDGKVLYGEISRCIYLDRNAIVPRAEDSKGWYGFNIENCDEKACILKNNFNSNGYHGPDAFTTSKYILFNSTSLNDLWQDSEEEKELLLAHEKLRKRISKSNHRKPPYYNYGKKNKFRGTVVYGDPES